MKNMEKQDIKFYMISDSISEIAERIVLATFSQYPNIKNNDVKKFPFITNEEDLMDILKDAVVENTILITTVVDKNLNTIIEDFVSKNSLKHIDYLYPLMNLITEQTGEKPLFESGALHSLDERYFDRMSAIEFAVKYDDGKNPKGFLQSDIVLLGISRTSKTPLSMYLANRSFKVSNLPLIPEVQLAPEIMEVPSEKIFGLIASPQYIMKVRSERMRMMGLNTMTSYNSAERIRKELSYAEELFEKLDARVINIENRSIEETAQVIEEALEESDRY